MLGEMAVRVMSARTFEDIVQTILDDIIAFHGAQYGNVQLPVGDHLVIAAQRGFDREFLRTFRRVKKMTEAPAVGLYSLANQSWLPM